MDEMKEIAGLNKTMVYIYVVSMTWWASNIVHHYVIKYGDKEDIQTCDQTDWLRWVYGCVVAFHERNFMGYVGGGSNRFLEADDIRGFTEV